MEAATQAAGTSPSAIEAASINPAETEAVIEAAPTSPGAAEAVSIVPASAEAVPEAACTSSAAVDLFLSELHSTDLFQVVCQCLDKAQQQSAAVQPLTCQQSQEANTQQMPTARHTVHQGQAERDKVSVSDVSCEAILASNDRGVHPAFAAASNHATSLAVASAKAPNFSTIWRNADVAQGLCQPAAEMADDNHQQPIAQPELDRAHTQSRQVHVENPVHPQGNQETHREGGRAKAY